MGRLGRVETGDDGRLVGLVSRLLACLQPGDETDDAEIRNRAACRALAAAVGAEREIAELRAKVARLQTLAVTDDLTGLLNRRGFEGELRRTLALCRRHHDTGTLIVVDLDQFKAVNDTFGHAAGDAVLREVGRLLRANVRSTDVIGRLGGDEFGILLTRSSPAGGCKRARAVERLLNTSTVLWNHRPVTIRASVGAQPFGPADDGEALLEKADAAMYGSKRRRLGDGECRRIA